MRPRSLRVFFLVAALVGACNTSTVSSPTASGDAATASASGSAGLPSTGDEPSTPLASEQASATTAAGESATPSAGEPSSSASSGQGPAAACSGNDQNRAFFESAAAALTWTVYCAVLPSGWFVDSGQFRQAAGGWIQIAYRGPGGARLELHEGAFCTTPDGCVPPGTDSGSAPFGDRTGTLVALDGGGWAVIVDRGKSISWLAVGTGMDESTFRGLVGALATVGG